MIFFNPQMLYHEPHWCISWHTSQPYKLLGKKIQKLRLPGTKMFTFISCCHSFPNLSFLLGLAFGLGIDTHLGAKMLWSLPQFGLSLSCSFFPFPFICLSSSALYCLFFFYTWAACLWNARLPTSYSQMTRGCYRCSNLTFHDSSWGFWGIEWQFHPISQKLTKAVDESTTTIVMNKMEVAYQQWSCPTLWASSAIVD